MDNSGYSIPTFRNVQEKATNNWLDGFNSASLHRASADKLTSTPDTAATTSQSSCFNSCTSTSSIRWVISSRRIAAVRVKLPIHDRIHTYYSIRYKDRIMVGMICIVCTYLIHVQLQAVFLHLHWINNSSTGYSYAEKLPTFALLA